jgi:hypothetical protein
MLGIRRGCRHAISAIVASDIPLGHALVRRTASPRGLTCEPVDRQTYDLATMRGLRREQMRQMCDAASVRPLVRLVLMAALIASCSGAPVASSSAASAGTPTASAIANALTAPISAQPIPSDASPTGCPNPDGGVCLGLLKAGTYTTKRFVTPITYQVPDGWSNLEDLKGNFLLIPPGATLDSFSGGNSDYIGIYASVAAAAADCAEGPAPGVARSAAAIAKWFQAVPGLTAAERPIEVGGLKGYVLDLTLAPGWTKGCPYSGGSPIVQVITGVPPSGLDHGLSPGQAMRLYVLDSNGGALAIEVTDVSGGGHLDGYTSVVSALKFAATN